MSENAPEIDLMRGDFYANDVHASYDWMRENAPIYYDEKNNLYALSLYEDVMTISKNSDVYGSHMGVRPDSPPMPMMACMDSPEHMIRRNLVNRKDKTK